ncbi:hypothetical protein TB1_014327 [Malus domestica]
MVSCKHVSFGNGEIDIDLDLDLDLDLSIVFPLSSHLVMEKNLRNALLNIFCDSIRKTEPMRNHGWEEEVDSHVNHAL